MPRPVRRRPRGLAKAIFSLTFLVLVLGACSSDGFPTSYTDQQDTETGISNVQQNWIDGCSVGVTQSDLAEDANSVCECSFATISSPVSDGGIAFEDFVALDSDLGSNPDKLKEGATLNPTEQQLVEIVKACIAGG